VAAQPWYTDVREKLVSNPEWFLKFDPSKKGNYTVPQCDTSFNPPRCSTLYHDQVQTPAYPTGDGSCSKPCDCGVPCGRYLWDTRNADLVDWLVDVHLTGDVSPSTLINNIFLLDDARCTFLNSSLHLRMPAVCRVCCLPTNEQFPAPARFKASMRVVQWHASRVFSGVRSLIGYTVKHCK
jgi:hypothetical protein